MKIIKSKLDVTDDTEIDHCNVWVNFKKTNQNKQLSVSFYVSKINTKFFKILKNTRIFIYEDFSKATIEEPFEKNLYSISSKTK